MPLLFRFPRETVHDDDGDNRTQLPTGARRQAALRVHDQRAVCWLRGVRGETVQRFSRVPQGSTCGDGCFGFFHSHSVFFCFFTAEEIDIHPAVPVKTHQVLAAKSP